MKFIKKNGKGGNFYHSNIACFKRRATVMPKSIQHYKCSQEEEEEEEEEEDILKVKVYAFFSTTAT